MAATTRPNNPASQCEGKANFKSFGEAERRAKRMRERHNASFSPYVCPHCHGVHLGENAPLITIKNYRLKKRRLKEVA